MSPLLLALAAELGSLLTARNETCATAESCTGGLVAGAITSIAGSSAWFDRGFVTYTNDAKAEQLGVDAGMLAQHGAVSEAVAAAMAIGAVAHSGATWAVAVTGIAGPGGGSAAKPVGTVCLGWCQRGGVAETQRLLLPGDRAAVRDAAVVLAIEGLIARLRQGRAGPSD